MRPFLPVALLCLLVAPGVAATVDVGPVDSVDLVDPADAASCTWIVDWPDLGLATCVNKTGCRVEVVTVDKRGETRTCVA